jgi:hypothetical protein
LDRKIMVFDKPFLLYMKSGVRGRPYFAMWVQTTEFLVKVGRTTRGIGEGR